METKIERTIEATRTLVIAKYQETGVYVDGFYTQFFEISKSGRAYKIEYNDQFIYVACSACVTAGNGCVFMPLKAIDSAVRFAEANGINEYVGG